MKRWLYAVCLLVVAQDRPGLSATTESPPAFAPVAILGDGMTTCGEYAGEPDRAGARVSWIMGYLTGANTRAISPFRMVGNNMTPANIGDWLKNFCARNPMSTVANAAERLRQDLELRGE